MPWNQKPPESAPLIHLNGTSAVDLVEHLENFHNALNDIRAFLRECAPNGRDYYPLGPAAMEAAKDQHQWRGEMLDAISADVFREIEAIQKQAEK